MIENPANNAQKNRREPPLPNHDVSFTYVTVSQQ
jgi:hypothetical protein